MKGTSSRCVPQEERARRILVVGITLDDFRMSTRLGNIKQGYIPFNDATQRMAGKVKLVRRELASNFV